MIFPVKLELGLQYPSRFLVSRCVDRFAPRSEVIEMNDSAKEAFLEKLERSFVAYLDSPEGKAEMQAWIQEDARRTAEEERFERSLRCCGSRFPHADVPYSCP